jgi:hypothetical protein
MPLQIEDSGELIFVNDFWDCNCEQNFTHRKEVSRHCQVCNGYEEECSDSRLDELLIFTPSLLTREERRECIRFLLNRKFRPNLDERLSKIREQSP